MYCKHCGKEIADDSNFCNYCGSSLLSISFRTDDDKDAINENSNKEETSDSSNETIQSNEADWVDYVSLGTKIIGGVVIAFFLIILMMMYLPNFYLGMALTLVVAIAAYLVTKKYIQKKDEACQSKKEYNPLFYSILFITILLLGVVILKIIEFKINS
jgi:hypothetical protein